MKNQGILKLCTVQIPERGILAIGLSGGDNLDHKSCLSKNKWRRDRSRGREGGDRTPHSNIVSNGLQEGMVVLLRCVGRFIFGNWK